MKKCKKIIITMFMLMIVISILFVGGQLSANENSIVQVTFMNNDINADNVDIQAKAQCLDGYKITAMQLDDQPKVDNITELDFTATENRDYIVKVYYQSLTEQKELTETFTTTVDSISSSKSSTPLNTDQPNTTASSVNFYINSSGLITGSNASKDITELVIPEKVNNIIVRGIVSKQYRQGVFEDYTNLISVTFPNSMISIGDYAFDGCISLKSVKLPNSLTVIGRSAFSDCKSITSMTIPNTVTNIDYAAFSFCSSLTSINIPSSVTHLRGMFMGCTSLESIDIPDSVTNLGSAFSGCTALTSVNIPDSVTNLRDAFDGCTALTSVNIPDSVTDLSYTFRDCESLTSIQIPDTVTDLEQAFSGCKSLTAITIPDSVTNLSTTFLDCELLTLIEIPDSLALTQTSFFNTFANCSSLKKVKIPNGVVDLAYTFKDCISLTEVEFPNSVKYIGGETFSNCKSLVSMTIPDSVEEIGEYTFFNCTSLKTINLGDNPSLTIRGDVFDECPLLTTINMGKCVENNLRFENRGFDYNEDKKSITANISKSVTKISPGVFSRCPFITDIIIPNTVTSIGDNAFSDCQSLTTIKIPNTVTSIGDYAFSGCRSLTSIEIPNTVTSIVNGMFQDCKSLTSIEIPNTVTSIGYNAFSNCQSLTSIEIPNTVTSIDGYAFSNCRSLTSIEIPNTVTCIADGVFEVCESLTSIKIPNTITSIGDNAFSFCRSLTSIEIPNTVTSIGTYALRDCELLTSIEIPNTVTRISSGVFSGCKSLTSIEIPNKVTSIGVYAFQECESLTLIEIPSTVTSIDYYAFINCKALTSVIIPESVISIGQKVFTGTPLSTLLIMLDHTEQIDLSENSPILSIENIDSINTYRVFMTKNTEVAESNIKHYKYTYQSISLGNVFKSENKKVIYTGTKGTEIYNGTDIEVPDDYFDKYQLDGTPTDNNTRIENNQLIIGTEENSTNLKVQSISYKTTLELPILIIPIKSVFIKEEPQNTYIEGDIYNPEGLVLTMKYEDGYEKDIVYNEENKDDFTFAYDQLDLTTTIQVIGYKGLTVEQELIIESKYHEKVLNDENNDLIVVKGEFTDNSYVTVEKIVDTDSELYKDLEDKTIVGNYEVKVVGEYQGQLFIVFDVGEENNNKKAYIRHLKQDGTIDEYEETVLAGKVGITVYELSPFVIYIDKEKIDNTPDINDEALPPIHNDEKSPTIDINDQENNVIPVIKGPLVEQKNKNQQNNITSQPATQDNQMIIPYFIILGIGILGVGYDLLTRKQFK